MTKSEKEAIIKLRRKNLSYAEIAKTTGHTVNAIKTFCYRNDLTEAALKVGINCKNCNKVLTDKASKRPRIFCSEKCKQNWWNKHRKERNSSKLVPHICAVCGETFKDYSGANRKYCSQACYRERNRHNGE